MLYKLKRLFSVEWHDGVFIASEVNWKETDRVIFEETNTVFTWND
jgi:hypothetical protein